MKKADIDDVADELTKLAIRGIDRAFLPVDKKGAIDIPELRHIVAFLVPDMWQRDKVTALRYVVGAAIGALPDEQLAHGAGVTLAEVAFHLYNIDPNDPTAEAQVLDGINGDDHRYNYLYAQLIARMKRKLPDSTRRRVVKNLRRRIAEKILRLEGESQKFTIDDSNHGTSSYAPRQRLEATIHSLYEAGASVVVLAGMPGMGKTALAKDFIQLKTQQQKKVVEVIASSREALERSLQKAVSVDSTGKQLASIASLEAAFTERLRSPVGPEFVLIDDLVDTELLVRLTDGAVKTKFLVTSRHRVPSVSPDHHIEVGELELDERVPYVRKYMPGCLEEDAAMLAGELHGYPLAIKAACGLLTTEVDANIEQFCTGLLRSAAAIFDGQDETGAEQLTAIYRQTLDLLKRADPQVYTALEIAVFLNTSSAIEWGAFLQCFAHISKIDDLRPQQKNIILRRALRGIQSRYLGAVDLEEDSFDGVRLHQLTQAILRTLLEERCVLVCRSIYSAILDDVKEFMSSTCEEEGDDTPYGLRYVLLDAFAHMHWDNLAPAFLGERSGRPDSVIDVDTTISILTNLAVAFGIDPESVALWINPKTNERGRVHCLPRWPDGASPASWTLEAPEHGEESYYILRPVEVRNRAAVVWSGEEVTYQVVIADSTTHQNFVAVLESLALDEGDPS